MVHVAASDSVWGGLLYEFFIMIALGALRGAGYMGNANPTRPNEESEAKFRNTQGPRTLTKEWS